MHSPNDVPVRVKLLPHGEGLDLPVYATAGAAGVTTGNGAGFFH